MHLYTLLNAKLKKLRGNTFIHPSECNTELFGFSESQPALRVTEIYYCSLYQMKFVRQKRPSFDLQVAVTPRLSDTVTQ